MREYNPYRWRKQYKRANRPDVMTEKRCRSCRKIFDRTFEESLTFSEGPLRKTICPKCGSRKTRSLRCYCNGEEIKIFNEEIVDEEYVQV
jgi:rRNA maturation endonuclease Nob1